MTLFEPGDALKPIKVFLIDEFALAGAPFTSVRVALNVDRDWRPDAAPQLVLFDDGGVPRVGGRSEWPVVTRPTVRVTVWSDGRDMSRRIAARAVALLLGKPVPGVAQVLPGASIIDSRDSRTSAELATFTVRTRVRTTAVL